MKLNHLFNPMLKDETEKYFKKKNRSQLRKTHDLFHESEITQNSIPKTCDP